MSHKHHFKNQLFFFWRCSASICVSLLVLQAAQPFDEEGGSYAANITLAQPIARVPFLTPVRIVSSSLLPRLSMCSLIDREGEHKVMRASIVQP